MPRTCSVCSHPESFAINEDLVLNKVSNRSIAKRFDLNHDVVQRHRTHIPDLLVNASTAMEIFEADDLLGEVRDLHARTLTILEAAEDAEELRTALAAIREARGNLELLAKVRQLIDTAPSMNIHLHPEWVRLKTAILAALDEHPLAREDVVAALRGAMNGNALEGR